MIEFQFPVDYYFNFSRQTHIPSYSIGSNSFKVELGFIEQKVILIGIEVNCNELSFNELHLIERHQQTEEECELI